MFRATLLIACSVLLAGCNILPPQAESVRTAPAPPPVVEVVSCPEPEPVPCVCPEPEKVMAPAPVPVPCKAGKQDFLIIGAVERVEVGTTGLIAKARIDTGATTSSIHAEDIVTLERDGKAWVRFSFDAGDGQPPTTIEKRVVRKVRIKRLNDEYQRRYVVKLQLRMGELEEIIEVTLSDRSDFEFPVLIGRNFLTDNAIVDVSKQFVAQ